MIFHVPNRTALHVRHHCIRQLRSKADAAREHGLIYQVTPMDKGLCGQTVPLWDDNYDPLRPEREALAAPLRGPARYNCDIQCTRIQIEQEGNLRLLDKLDHHDRE